MRQLECPADTDHTEHCGQLMSSALHSALRPLDDFEMCCFLADLKGLLLMRLLLSLLPRLSAAGYVHQVTESNTPCILAAFVALFLGW